MFPQSVQSCHLVVQGRSDTFATEYDLEAEEYVPIPKGDVHKRKEVIQDVTLHDLDVANARHVWGKGKVGVGIGRTLKGKKILSD